jgi:hypothetical protein
MWAAQKEKSSGRRAEKSKRALQVAAAWEARGISGFDRMEYLQFLFALRHIDPCQLFFSFSTLFVAPEAPGRIEGHRWLGSGKYPSVNVAFAFDQFLVEALALGFVEVDCDKGGIGLSDNGQRLLDAVHPDNEDIDAICRWADPIMIERMEAVDAWVLRFFRKMKTRVNLMD